MQGVENIIDASNEAANAPQHLPAVPLSQCPDDSYSGNPASETLFEETHYWFACPVRDCNQRYEMGHGYYTLIDGKLDDTTNKRPCPVCSLRLYLARRAATFADSVWKCANEDSPSNKRRT